ncbi:MAG: hypothetical protein ABR874_12565 [Candidatus Sulfotelmatobacter sp.]|jgi:hypothetical protein
MKTVPSRCESMSGSFNHRLSMYSVGAAAAGVGVLALAQPASGEIIYTHINVSVRGYGDESFAIDVNNDGKPDFSLRGHWSRTYFGSGGNSSIYIYPAKGNGVAGFGGSAAALVEGDTIDDAHRFAGREMAWMNTFFGSDFGAGGKWKNVKNGYLGLEFKVDGQIHYGWARLTVRNEAPLTATLTGYAYETAPNTPIVAGDTSGAEESSLILRDPDVRNTTTLGALALGSLSAPEAAETGSHAQTSDR